MNKLLKSALIVLLVVSIWSFPEGGGATAETLKENKVTLILNTRQLYHNGAVYLSGAPHVVNKGVTFISIRALADRLGYKVSYNRDTKQYTFSNETTSLQLAANEKQYRFNGKQLSFTDKTVPYTTKGTMMVPLRDVTKMFGMRVFPKLSENKVELIWYTELPKPAAKLEASFETNKVQYKIGEPIEYFDLSVAEGSKIKKVNWTNNEKAFFTSGLQTITLQIENELGHTSIASQTIFIEEEVMYTKPEYDALFTPVGEKFPIVREAVLDYLLVPFQLNHQPMKLVRSNSPERIVQEGIYYQDHLSGNIRFLIHHQNARPNPVKIYLLAKNNGNTTATVTVNNLGMFGPNRFVSATGKNSVANYLTGLQQYQTETITIKPDHAELIVAELSSKAIPTESVMTLYADVYADQELSFQVIVLDEENDLQRTYPFLQGINATRDGKHTRGTFENGNRELVVSQVFGTQLSRIILGDGTQDPYVTGVDNFSGYNETNFGNRGVFYTVQLERVAPNTALVLNPRGGHYAGAFLVNGQLVMAPTNGVLHDPNEVVVLHRTGQTEEKVTIQFIPASGSNLPINLLSIPLKIVE
ncbi:hypothetical protein DS745_05020 [Anaerobacillus alkaliphilus]|uniref:Copper amine oxidase-like N-terminal domain-containing protein n=1 Tax=Anaerobacillus alkaliphilus TaxID=1548597 RepID=A0A4Q0VVL0_9BACI|nr:stalk domain-containing protein [Anaerobacillus alkaliphilus]RXJ02947.1 hypothetical protein DS745_05020 [Anaerobacillus alkaliphilus]